MADDSRTSLEAAFHERLIAASAEVKQHTRAGIQRTLVRIQSVGGLQTAKRLLRPPGDSPLDRLLNRPDEYFRAAERVGRMDLSIEAIVLEPGWSNLFTPEEIDNAASRLREQGFNPSLEPSPLSERTELALSVRPPFTELSLRKSRAWLLDELGRAACDLAAEQYVALRAEGRPGFSRVIRDHLNKCIECRKLYPDLVAAYEGFDQEALRIWMDLLKNFQASLLLGDADLKRFMPTEPEDYQDSKDYEADLYGQLLFVRPRCAWRALQLGCHIGHFMSAFSNTYDEWSTLWLQWRCGEVRGPVSDFIRAMDRDLFVLGLTALNLLLVRDWPKGEDDILWIPTDGDVKSIPGLVQADRVSDLDEWEEILGQPPKDLNLLGILHLAHRAAAAEAGDLEAPNETATARESREQWDRMEEMFRTIQRSQAEALERQDAVIGQLERMVLYMKSADRYACEESLLVELPGVYEKLTPEVRNLLLASEQVYRTPGFAAPATIVHGLATAFELQLKHSVMSGLFEHLRYHKVEKLKTLKEWTDVEQRDKPLWWPNAKADKFTLGEMKLIIRHTHPAIGAFLEAFSLDGADIQETIGSVSYRRNPAAHGECVDIGTAEAIRADWFHWGGRPGGVFSVFFRNE